MFNFCKICEDAGKRQSFLSPVDKQKSVCKNLLKFTKGSINSKPLAWTKKSLFLFRLLHLWKYDVHFFLSFLVLKNGASHWENGLVKQVLPAHLA